MNSLDAHSQQATDSQHPQVLCCSSIRNRRFLSILQTVGHHLKKHVGVGIVCAVGYFDPGNWSVDLQAGSSFGYRPMLFVLLMSALGAVILQTLAAKLGCVTGLDLASHCRLLLHDHSTHPRLVRRFVLYPLYILSEIAIVSTDLAELLGGAIGLCLLFPKLPLWGGVVATAADVLVFLAIGDPSRGQRPARLFEITIMTLVFGVFGCFVALLFKVSPDWPEVFLGFIPNKNLFETQPDAVYTAIGILGATVMPHSLFLGSSLATQDRVSSLIVPNPPAELRDRTLASTRSNLCGTLRSWALPLFRVSNANRITATKDYRSQHGQRENNSPGFIRAHLRHGVADVVLSLLLVAVPINSAILILAAAVFAGRGINAPAGLFDAHSLIEENIGKPAAFVFAVALLFSGQTSSITATFAGQIVSEGFIEWRISPFLRRLITRLLGLIPSVIVAVAGGRNGIDTMLVASQVVLSVVLPFVALPLIYLTSSKTVMCAGDPIPPILQSPTSTKESPGTIALVPIVEQKKENADSVDAEKVESALLLTSNTVDYSNGWVMVIICYSIWAFILIANAYAIVMLAMGNTGQ